MATTPALYSTKLSEHFFLNVVFLIFPIYATFQSVINNKWLNFFLEFQIKIKDEVIPGFSH